MSVIDAERTAEAPATSSKLVPRLRLALLHVAFIALMLLVWEGGVRAGVLESFVLSRPPLVHEELVTIVLDPATWPHVAITFYEIGVGLVLGGSTGILLGVVAFTNRSVERGARPLFTALYTVPRLALVPLFMLWFGFGSTPQIIVAAIHGFIFFWMATIAALGGVERVYGPALRVQGAGFWDRIRYLYVPGSIPFYLAAFRQAVALAISTVIVAQMIGPQGGIGYLLARRLGRFDSNGVIALVIIAAIIGVTIDKGVAMLEDKGRRWA